MNAIQHIIDNAMQHAEGHRQLRDILNRQLPQVQRLVHTPEDTQVAQETLYDFTLRYIEQTPRMLFNLSEAAKEVGLIREVAPILAKAEAFFSAPVLTQLAPSNLFNLVQEAYLAHRLIEEVNDITQFKFGQALVPFDMTMSNLIIHAIIDERRACELDIIVEDAVDHLSSIESCVLCNKKSASNLIQIFQRMPSLSMEMGLESSFV